MRTTSSEHLRRHLAPASLHRHPVQLQPQLLQPMQRQDRHIGARRPIEADPAPRRLHAGGNRRIIRPGHDKAAAMHIEVLARPPAALHADSRSAAGTPLPDSGASTADAAARHPPPGPPRAASPRRPRRSSPAPSAARSAPGRNPASSASACSARCGSRAFPASPSIATPRATPAHSRAAEAPARSTAMPKRRSLWPFTWLPSPSTNRPREFACRSHACDASTVGLRGNATATDGVSSTRCGRHRGDRERGEHIVAQLDRHHRVEARRLRVARRLRGRVPVVHRQAGEDAHRVLLRHCGSEQRSNP